VREGNSWDWEWEMNSGNKNVPVINILRTIKLALCIQEKILLLSCVNTGNGEINSVTKIQALDFHFSIT
jgi:hypothetical protein